MTTPERLVTGLQEFDVTLDLVGQVFDHLPVVTDFRVASRIPEPSTLLLSAFAAVGLLMRRRPEYMR